jgi:hypothetical protein
MSRQSLLASIVDDVEADFGEGVTFTLFGSQDVIMRLVLKTVRTQLGREVLAKKLHAVLLVGFAPHAHPDQMNVIRHQAVGRAEKPLARGGVEHDFAKAFMERVAQPSCAAIGSGHGPVNYCVSLVVFAWQALQIETPIRA